MSASRPRRSTGAPWWTELPFNDSRTTLEPFHPAVRPLSTRTVDRAVALSLNFRQGRGLRGTGRREFLRRFPTKPVRTRSRARSTLRFVTISQAYSLTYERCPGPASPVSWSRGGSQRGRRRHPVNQPGRLGFPRGLGRLSADTLVDISYTRRKISAIHHGGIVAPSNGNPQRPAHLLLPARVMVGQG